MYDEALFERTGYLAGTDERRADELNRYLAAPDVRGIVCARGGYGVLRILDRLDAAALKHDPKVVVGFSDLTALLAWCVLEAGVRPIHGPVVTQLAELPAQDVAWMWRMLESPDPAGEIAGELRRIGDRGGGTIDGRLVGGNLEMVTRLVGTPWQFDLGAGIAFFEDVGERPYKIDRQLTQLKLAGALDGVRAVAVGDFVRCDEPEGEGVPTALEVVDERLAAFQIPAVAGLPVGHGSRHLALPIGATCAVNLGEAKLVLEEAAVA